MRFQYLLTLLGLGLIAFGLVERGWELLLVWLGIDFLLLGIAHARNAHRIFGKRPDGTMSFSKRLIFLPLLGYTSVVWHLARVLSREPASQNITSDLVIGRRLLASEIDGEFDNYVDLTAEFSEPLTIRRSPSYRSFPVLDGAAPDPESLREAIASLRPGRTFIHCAQGHGRTGLFTLAVLLKSGAAGSVDDGLRMLQAIRPGIRLSRAQQECIRLYADALARNR
ncbi:MAG: hypothetical protein JWM68_4823 [Verrucomicrobiales bacterium]|nr:hypothetical protein [Verrucomicrobiales bacterium]